MSDTTPLTVATESTSPRQQPRKKPISLIGMEPATEIESYDAVPWFRRMWFALGPLFAQALLVNALIAGEVTTSYLFPVFAPVLVLIASTGEVYAKAHFKKMKEYSDADVWRFTTASRVLFVLVALAAVASFVGAAIWG